MTDFFKGFLLESIENGTAEVIRTMTTKSEETDMILAQMLENQEYQSCLMELQNGLT